MSSSANFAAIGVESWRASSSSASRHRGSGDHVDAQPSSSRRTSAAGGASIRSVVCSGATVAAAIEDSAGSQRRPGSQSDSSISSHIHSSNRSTQATTKSRWRLASRAAIAWQIEERMCQFHSSVPTYSAGWASRLTLQDRGISVEGIRLERAHRGQGVDRLGGGDRVEEVDDPGLLVAGPVAGEVLSNRLDRLGRMLQEPRLRLAVHHLARSGPQEPLEHLSRGVRHGTLGADTRRTVWRQCRSAGDRARSASSVMARRGYATPALVALLTVSTTRVETDCFVVFTCASRLTATSRKTWWRTNSAVSWA